MMTKGQFYQGDYKPKHPEKYIGNTLPHYRSGWERRVFYYMDMNESIAAWGSECVVVPYVSPKDGEIHRYYPDIFCRVKTVDGLKDFMLEIKPMAQSQPAKKPKKMTAKAIMQFNESQEVYLVNRAKWEACEKWCKERNITFRVVTENELRLL